ncbi:hypothetical protein Ancab_027838 [Ancistrocladus abbreviatus]
MHRANWLLWWEQGKPYLFLSLNVLCLAIFMILVEDLFSDGINSFVFVVYEHAISTILLSLLAFFLERRPPLSFKIICYAFLLGLLQVTLCQMLMTVALQFISSTYESVAINLVPSIVFVLALAFGLEKLSFPTINGQAKVWGLAFSAAGAITVVLWKGPQIFKLSFSKALQATSNGGVGIIGSIMIVIGILATCFWNITVDHVVKIYPAELSLTAMMSFFGTIQTAIITAFLVSNSSWKLKWEKGLTLSTLLLGGTVVTGLSYYVMAWSIKKKGPVFTTAFNPLLVVFSFLLQTFVLGSSVHLGSVVGAVFVMIGLYLLLWAKANDVEKNVMSVDATLHSPLIQP